MALLMRPVLLQGPEAQHESYKKGQHLKGVDAANAERVRAEMVQHVLAVSISSLNNFASCDLVCMHCDGKRSLLYA